MTSYGGRMVGLEFNPSADPDVARIKELYAAAIDLCDGQRSQTTDAEKRRHLSVAITEAQTAYMWAVQAITFQP